MNKKLKIFFIIFLPILLFSLLYFFPSAKIDEKETGKNTLLENKKGIKKEIKLKAIKNNTDISKTISIKSNKPSKSNHNESFDNVDDIIFRGYI